MSDKHLETLADGEPTTGLSLHKGFPNAALDHADQHTPLALDLNQLLIRHPTSSYLFRIAGGGWQERGIFDGDIALIDRQLTPKPSDLVLSWQEDRFEITAARLLPEGSTSWGVITAIIHQYKP